MIPKKIHYCWFGGNPLPNCAEKYIKTWRKFFSDYEIIEWNESNFDISTKPLYVRQAYEKKKYAFVSDYARFEILYNHGGVYFDVDVEVIKSFDSILSAGAFMGCETDGAVFSDECADNCETISVNPGLGMAAPAGSDLLKMILDSYQNDVFIFENGDMNLQTIVSRTTDILMKNGLQNIRGIQKVLDIVIYPKEYFCPKSLYDGIIRKTENTYSIHHFDASWFSEEWQRSKEKHWKKKQKKARKIARHEKIKSIIFRCGGEKIYRKIRKG